jgi:hypothetical protein
MDSQRKQRVGRIFCGLVSYKSGLAASHRAFWVGSTLNTKHKTVRTHGGGSLLASAFNGLYIGALNLQEDYEDGRKAFAEGQKDIDNPYKDNGGHHQWYWAAGFKDASENVRENDITHFAMLHDDVVPEDGWLDVLVNDLVEADADLCAAVIPIKDFFGLTSCAIDDPKCLWSVERRITMAEMDALPEVFTAADCGYPDRHLLANTGCWICRLDQPWNREEDEKGCLKAFFTIKDAVWKQENRRYANGVAPEDWNFSRMIGQMGGKVVCTKRVKLDHYGDVPFTNKQTTWGTLKYDMVFGNKFGNKPIGFREDDVIDEMREFAFNEELATK